MTRGGRIKSREAPERRCIVTGESGPTAGLIRFVLDMDGRVTPDLAEKLPGRGVWLTAERALVDRAVAKKSFARAFRRPVEPPLGGADEAGADPSGGAPRAVGWALSDLLESLLARRAVQALSMARKAGLAVTGFEKVREAARGARALLHGADAAFDGVRKLQRLAPGLETITCFSSAEIGGAFQRAKAVHAALAHGGATESVIRDCKRLQGFRPVSALISDAEAATGVSRRPLAADPSAGAD